MKTTIHRKCLVSFLVLFGEVYKRIGKMIEPGGHFLYTADGRVPPLCRPDGAGFEREMNEDDCLEDIHKELRAVLNREGVVGLVMFENMDMSSQHLGERAALTVGPNCEFKSVKECRDRHLGAVPSQFKYPLAAYVKDEADWDEVAINGQKYVAEMRVDYQTCEQLDAVCRETGNELLGKDEKVFDREVVFENRMRMEIHVIASDQKGSDSGPREPCWAQGVLYDPGGTELGCTDVGGVFPAEFCVYLGIDAYTCNVISVKGRALELALKDRLATAMGIPKADQDILDISSDHPYSCDCGTCLKYWRAVGPNPSADPSMPYGPHAIEEVEDDSEQGQRCSEMRYLLHIEQNARTECVRFVTPVGYSLRWNDADGGWYYEDLKFEYDMNYWPITSTGKKLPGKVTWVDEG